MNTFAVEYQGIEENARDVVTARRRFSGSKSQSYGFGSLDLELGGYSKMACAKTVYELRRQSGCKNKEEVPSARLELATFRL